MFSKITGVMVLIFCIFVQSAYANQPIVVISLGEKEQVYKIVELSTQKINVLSRNSQIELIFSPIERVTLKNGYVLSYTYIKQEDAQFLKRVELEPSEKFKSKFDSWESEIEIFSSYGSTLSNITSIDSMGVVIEFVNNKYILRFV